jgi:hypothetical protein
METAPSLTPTELTRIFGVNPRTFAQWMSEGEASSVRTLDAPKRFDADGVAALKGRDEVIVLGRQEPGAAPDK